MAADQIFLFQLHRLNPGMRFAVFGNEELFFDLRLSLVDDEAARLAGGGSEVWFRGASPFARESLYASSFVDVMRACS